MPLVHMRNTVERLDKPSSYAMSKYYNMPSTITSTFEDTPTDVTMNTSTENKSETQGNMVDRVKIDVEMDLEMNGKGDHKGDVEMAGSERAEVKPPTGPRRIILPVKKSFRPREPSMSMRGIGDTLGQMFGLGSATTSSASASAPASARPRIISFANRHNQEQGSRYYSGRDDGGARQFYDKKRTVASLTPTEPQYKKRRRNPDEAQNGDRAPSPDLEERLKDATTLYVGNLSFFTTEEQIHELFSKAGEIKRLVMGLDRFNKTPCGFCFVEYYTHADALDCLKYIGGTKLDERIIRTDLDEGFSEGRQYGRGKSGGQVRDEYRQEFDPGRGGFGRVVADEGYADEYGGGR